MASTNPFPQARPGGRRGRSAASGPEKRGSRSPGRGRARQQAKAVNSSSSEETGTFSGWPSLEELKPVLLFLLLPGLVAIGVILGGGLPKPVLYLSGLVIGLVVAFSTFRTVEITVACIILYLPFAKSYVIPVLPGLNGTNMLILLGLGTAFLRASREKNKFVSWPPGSQYVIAFGIYTALSAVTIVLQPGGSSVLKAEILSFKSWLDQFIIYLILAACIRDKAGAKRALVYMMIGSMCVVIHTIPEMFDKMGRSSIEKSRLMGPQLQANNFGGFLAYTLLPLLAFFMVYIKDVRAWLLTPYFLLAIKILITTFSRGAYLGMAAGGLLAGYYRGKGFLISIGTLAVVFVLIFPQIIPDSITARMGNLIGGDSATLSAPEEENLDKSSSTRIDMWKGAVKMMAESPLLGKGFKSFPLLKDQYVEGEHEEDDPHSMFMYLGSQMGIPAMLLFVFLIIHLISLGRFHSRNKHDQFIRAAGIGGAAAAVCFGVINIFGSRAIALNFTIYFWTYILILQVLRNAANEADTPVVKQGRARNRGKARGAMPMARQVEGAAAAIAAPTRQRLQTTRKERMAAGRRLPKRGAAAYQAQKAARVEQEALRGNQAATKISDSKALAMPAANDSKTA